MTTREVLDTYDADATEFAPKPLGWWRRMFTRPIPPAPGEVHLTGIDIPFWNLVGFVLKLYLAIIVAGIAFAILGAFFWAAIAGMIAAA